MRTRTRIFAAAVVSFWCESGSAAPPPVAPRAVILLEPPPESCVSAQAVATAIAGAGAFASSVAADAPRDAPEDATVFQIEGGPERLTIRSWSVAQKEWRGDLGPWPAPWRERAADVEREVLAGGCQTATEAAIAFIVSMLVPEPATEPVPEQAAPRASLSAVLEQARRELAPDFGLTAGVLHTELGFTLIVEDLTASCRRGTWLDVEGAEPRMGESVARLQALVVECVAERQRERTRRSAKPVVARVADKGFDLPGGTGALVAAAGFAVAYASVERLDDPTAAVLYAALPPVLGGIGGYWARDPWREALWLAGYWGGVAGTSMIVAAESGSPKPVLIGGFLTVGAASSAALSLFDAASDPAERLPPWAVALPATAGAALGALGLSIEGEKQNSVELATLGGISSLLPAVWLAIASDARERSRGSRPALTVGLNGAGALVELSGEL